MARDYGQRRPGRQRSSAPNQLLVIAVTFLLGYATASIFDLEKLTHWMNTQVLAQQDAKQEPAKPAAQTAQIPPKPKFEFYTLLANEKVPSSAASGAHTAPVTTGVATNPNSAANAAIRTASTQPLSASQSAELKSAGKGSYSVQVASFKARKDAEHMKGLLTLKGFDVTVVPVSQARGNWFRVVVGPYPNRLLAQQAQSTLAKTEHLQGMVTNAGA